MLQELDNEKVIESFTNKNIVKKLCNYKFILRNILLNIVIFNFLQLAFVLYLNKRKKMQIGIKQVVFMVSDNLIFNNIF